MTSLLPLNQPAPQKITEIYCSHLVRPERVLYRYEITVSNYGSEGISTRVYRRIFPVIGETAASWVFDEFGRRRHVLKGDGKRYAHEDADKALFSLRKRTRWRQSHAHWALTTAHCAIEAYNELFGGDKPLQTVGHT